MQCRRQQAAVAAAVAATPAIIHHPPCPLYGATHRFRLVLPLRPPPSTPPPLSPTPISHLFSATPLDPLPPPPLFIMARWALPLLALLLTLLLPLTATASSFPTALLPVAARVHGGPHDKSNVAAGTCGGYQTCGTTTVSDTLKHTRFCYVRSAKWPAPAEGDTAKTGPTQCRKAPYGCIRVTGVCATAGWWKCKCDSCKVVQSKVDRWCRRA